MPVRKEDKKATKSSAVAESKKNRNQESPNQSKSPAKASSNPQKKVKPSGGAIGVDAKKKRPVKQFKHEESFQRFIYQL